VTVDPSRLQAILDRLETQNPLGDEDREILAKAVRLGQSTLASGAQAVAIGGNVDNSVIVTGDRNIVIPKELAEFLQGQVGKSGEINQQIGDRQTIINNTNVWIVESEATLPQQRQGQRLSLLLRELPEALIRQAYRAALPMDADLFSAQPIGLDQVVADLQNGRWLESFVQIIVDNPEVPRHIREKMLETIGRSPSSSIPVASTQPLLQSYLLIILKPESTPGKFRVNGCLIPDDMERDLGKRFQALDIDKSEKGLVCGPEQIPAALDTLLGLGVKHLDAPDHPYELTIEIFLPMDSLCTAVEHWQIDDGDDDKVPVGTRHRVVVRSSERLDPAYLDKHLNQWRVNWKRVKAAEQVNPGQDDFEHLSDFCNCNWKRLRNNLEKKLGLKLTCGLVDDHKKDFFKAILKAATPIAIWSRSDLMHPDQAGEIDTLIMSNPLLKLSEAVWRQRQQADEEDDPAMHLGAHLGILWEDPYRLTPDAMMQLMSPGQ
jgi:hypothetical protein